MNLKALQEAGYKVKIVHWRYANIMGIKVLLPRFLFINKNQAKFINSKRQKFSTSQIANNYLTKFLKKLKGPNNKDSTRDFLKSLIQDGHFPIPLIPLLTMKTDQIIVTDIPVSMMDPRGGKTVLTISDKDHVWEAEAFCNLNDTFNKKIGVLAAVKQIIKIVPANVRALLPDTSQLDTFKEQYRNKRILRRTH